MKQIEKIAEWLGSGSINIFGMPFAGKDTQGELLATALDAVRLSGGEILRNSVIPPHVQEAIDAGNLAPTDEYIDIVLPYLSKQEFAGKPLILSSVGRWKGEEDGVIAACEQSGHPIKAVIYLNIDESMIKHRLHESQKSGSRGERADDAEHLLETRLTEYRNKTLPVIEHYRSMGLLIEVDANHGIDDVQQAVVAALVEHAASAYGASDFGSA
tara:strand:- start:6906 stop:7547 length:642 start_codon:yes stop_codon:yes gene_type:complete